MQSHLETRPAFAQSEASTRGHVLVIMLAYLLKSPGSSFLSFRSFLSLFFCSEGLQPCLKSSPSAYFLGVLHFSVLRKSKNRALSLVFPVCHRRIEQKDAPYLLVNCRREAMSLLLVSALRQQLNHLSNSHHRA